EVWRDRKGVQAVGRSFEAPPLPCLEGILSHQPGDPMTTDGDPVIAKLAWHARAAVGCVRQCKGRANMGQQPHVLMPPTAGRSILPGKIAALADAKNLAETLDRDFLLRRIDETEPHRLPSLAKKVAALFRISRSCRKISFSRRNRFSSAARSSCRSGGGASISCSRRLSSQRRSVERPTPRSLAISLCVRPLTSTNRTASASNSFPNRRCGFPLKISSFPQKSSPLSQGKSTLSVPGSQHMAPDLLLHPVFHEAEALAGVSHRKVVHPTAQHRVDQLHDPINRLRLVTAEHIFEPA